MTTVLNKIQIVIAMVFVIAFVICFIPSANHNIRVHDTFDGNFSSKHVLAKSGHFWDTDPMSIVPGIMNGLPRGVFSKHMELNALMMWLFGSLNGFTFTFLIVRLIGFFGIYLFGRDHLFILSEQKGLLVLCAVAFGCLPFFVVQGITTSGIPILLWAFYNLIKKEKVKLSFLVFIIFALWSQLVLVGFHAILILGLLTVYHGLVARKNIVLPVLALVVLGVTYILADYMLFYMHGVSTGYESSRGGFEKELGLNFKGVIAGTITTFFTGDYSSANYFGYLFLPVILCYLFLAVKRKTKEPMYLGFVLLGTLMLSSFFINLFDWKGMAPFYEKFSFAKSFNLQRFTNLLPGLFFCTLLVMVLKITAEQKKWSNELCSFLILISLVLIWRGNISFNNSGFKNDGVKIQTEKVPCTFNEFFDPFLYSQVKKEMGKDSSRNLVHFGVSPSASKYAGINVLDDYQGDYPRPYKTQFRKIIAGELDKSPLLKEYFDNWGARCYIFSARSFANKLLRKNGLRYEPLLTINTQQLKMMDCHYILSNILIGNTTQLGIKLQKVLVGTYMPKPHFLYKVI